MSHSLDFVDLNKKLFLARHLVAGTKEYCRREQLYQGTQAPKSAGWDNYAENLGHIVSNDLIEISAKFRVMQDTTAAQLSFDYFRKLDEKCQSIRNIGTVLCGNFDLTLRESCNKVIHATRFELVFQNDRSVQPPHLYSFWNGICQFSGTHQRNQWKVALDIYRWSESMGQFLEELASNVV